MRTTSSHAFIGLKDEEIKAILAYVKAGGRKT